MSAVRSLSLAAACVTLFTATRAHAYCPSYTPQETAGGQSCGVDPVGGANPGVASWNTIFATVAQGQNAWGPNGPAIGPMGDGCGKPVALHDVCARFPVHVLKAIAMQESGWTQFCVPDSPPASVGAPERTIVSFDCGYGIGQVTTGMHVGETPSFDRARVASDAEYNLATGTLILLDKWKATACVGDNDPDVIEDWYTAIWAYNGLAYSNNPNNPNLDPGRAPYNPANGGSYAYQERVYGWMEFPPSPAHWTSVAPAYPNRGDVGASGAPPALPEPSCAGPTNCTQTRSTHLEPPWPNDAGVCGDGSVGPPPADAGGSGDGSITGGGDGGRADGGPLFDDAGNPLDGGAITTPGAPSSDGGCGCRAAGGSDDASAPLALLGVGLALACRRRRQGEIRAESA